MFPLDLMLKHLSLLVLLLKLGYLLWGPEIGEKRRGQINFKWFSKSATEGTYMFLFWRTDFGRLFGIMPFRALRIAALYWLNWAGIIWGWRRSCCWFCMRKTF